MRRAALRLAGAVAFLYLATVAGLAAFVAVWPPPADLPRGAAVIVLAGGQRPDGTLGAATALRTEAGIEVFRRTDGAVFLATGGAVAAGAPPVAAVMADAARAAGLPPAAIRAETEARSTLQNALFAADLLPGWQDRPVIVVTQRFHLPRAWLSFRWAGFGRVAPWPADPPPERWTAGRVGRLFRETAKLYLNAARAAVYTAARALDAPDGTRDWLLR